MDKFWSKVDIPDNLDDCWEWKASSKPNGYGQFGIRGRNRYAHRISWERFTGKPIPEGMCVLHRCDNKLCVNPDHLFLGTIADNNADMTEKGRRARGAPLASKGEAHGMSKLTREQVLEIRSREGETQQSLADEFGISDVQIGRILSRKSWSHA